MISFNTTNLAAPGKIAQNPAIKHSPAMKQEVACDKVNFSSRNAVTTAAREVEGPFRTLSQFLQDATSRTMLLVKVPEEKAVTAMVLDDAGKLEKSAVFDSETQNSIALTVRYGDSGSKTFYDNSEGKMIASESRDAKGRLFEDSLYGKKRGVFNDFDPETGFQTKRMVLYADKATTDEFDGKTGFWTKSKVAYKDGTVITKEADPKTGDVAKIVEESGRRIVTKERNPRTGAMDITTIQNPDGTVVKVPPKPSQLGRK